MSFAPPTLSKYGRLFCEYVFEYRRLTTLMPYNLLHSGSRWSLPNSGVRITPIVSPSARSVGDVMRELDTKQIITSDFILVTGDVVSTIPIQDVLREHKERRKVSKDCIMTMVLKPAGPRDRPRYISGYPYCRIG